MTTTSLQNWITLSAIQIGGAICLPMILIGFELSKTNSLMGCLFSIAIANSALFVLGLLSSKMSVSFRKTTGELAISYFGPFGRFLFAGVLFISMCGWFSIQTEIMTEDIHHFIQNLNPFYGLIGLSLLIYGINIIGISAIARFSSATVPLMLVTLVTVIACNFSCTIDLFEGEKSLIPTTAISLLLSSCIACIFDFPTFFRHAKDEKEAYKATSMIFFVGIPLVELLGVLIGKTSDSKSLIEALLIFQHPLWNTWICAFILLCGLSTNTANLYSAAMSLQCIFKGLSEKKATLMSVAFCIGLSFFKITNHLVISRSDRNFSRKSKCVYACTVHTKAGKFQTISCYMFLSHRNYFWSDWNFLPYKNFIASHRGCDDFIEWSTRFPSRHKL